MIRKGRHKLIHYHGFGDEFLISRRTRGTCEPDSDNRYKVVLEDLWSELRAVCDPKEVERKAHADQRAMVDALGGLEAVRNLGPKGATPPPAAVG